MTFSSSNTHSFLKKIGVGIMFGAFTATLFLPFFREKEWSMMVWGISLFIGIHGLFLYMYAISHDEVPVGPRLKRAMFFYSVPELLPGLFLLYAYLLIRITRSQTFSNDWTFIGIVLLVGLVCGIIIGLAKMRFILRRQIRDGVIGEMDERGKLINRCLSLIRWIIYLGIWFNREIIFKKLFQEFSTPDVITLASAYTVLLGSLSLGAVIAQSIWILLWERLNNRSLYM